MTNQADIHQWQQNSSMTDELEVQIMAHRGAIFREKAHKKHTKSECTTSCMQDDLIHIVETKEFLDFFLTKQPS